MVSAATVEYDLTIARQEVNFTGQPVQAMTLNGQLPGPMLRFTEGDHAVIRVHNQMDVALVRRSKHPLNASRNAAAPG